LCHAARKNDLTLNRQIVAEIPALELLEP